MSRVARFHVLAVLATAMLASACWAPSVHAANEWDLDPSYRGGGIFEDDLSRFLAATTQIDHVRDAAIDDQGRTVLVGEAYDASGIQYLTVARYLPDGSLDTSFSGDGFNSLDYASGYAVAIQPDGKIVVAGTLDWNNSDDFLVARFLANGDLDTTFNGTAGYRTENFGGNEVAHGVAIGADGNIWVAGQSGAADASFLVTTPAGGFVAKFQTDLHMKAAATTGSDGARAIRYDAASDRFLVAGFYGTTGQIAVARYVPSTRALDTTWNGDGITTFGDMALHEMPKTLALSSGRLLVAGTRATGAAGDDVLVVAFKPADGTLDATWNGVGSSQTDVLGSSDVVGDATLDSTGRLYVTGSATADGTSHRSIVLRYASGGGLDPTWNGTGIASTPAPSGAATLRGAGIAIDASGRVMVAGYATDASRTDSFVARYLGASVAVTLDLTGCSSNTPATSFGEVLPGAAAITGVDCVVTFGTASTLGASLNVFQADGAAPAMMGAAASVPDYAPGSSDWMTSGGMFGACLRAVGPGVTPTWTVDATCPQLDGSFWNPIAPSSGGAGVRVASLAGAAPGVEARLRFGAKTAPNQPPGSYAAELVFQVVANP